MSETPRMVGEVVGRRAWRVANGRAWQTTLSLSSLNAGVWGLGVVAASCWQRPEHRAPAPYARCECGLYAAFSPAGLAPFVAGAAPVIRGLVTAWGRMEVHVDGFRAEFAQVAALVDEPALEPGLAQALATRYGVPLISETDWADDSFIKEFGEIIPLELRPKIGETRGTVPPYRGHTRRDDIGHLFGWPGGLAMAGAIAFGQFWTLPVAMVLMVLVVGHSVRHPEWWDRPWRE